MFVEQDETQTIPLDGLVSSLDGELTYELTDTPAGVVEASVTGSSLTVKGLSKGYTTLNIKATDEDGDTVSLMVLVYVGSTKIHLLVKVQRLMMQISKRMSVITLYRLGRHLLIQVLQK
jgi:hypothetical protein